MSPVETVTAPTSPTALPGRSGRSRRVRSAIGFALGAVATLAVLLGARQFQERDRPAPAVPPPAPRAATPSMAMEPDHQAEDVLSSEESREIAALKARVAAAPEDQASRKKLAVRLIETGQFVDAFGEAKEVLKRDPNDIDGLYVQGVVRLAMGMWPQAQELLDRVLTAVPDHLPAMIAKGRWYRATGQTPLAVATWEKALALAGRPPARPGAIEQIERLLAETREGGAQP